MVMVFTASNDDAPPFESTLEPETRESDKAERSATTRKCLATGEVLPKAELIRFVLGPDKTFVPDLAERLPGRGLWVKASRDALDTAVRKNFFTKAARTHVKPPADFSDQVERLLAKRCLDLLGLARAAGAVVVGQPQVEELLKSKRLAFVLVASDAGADGLKKLHHAEIVHSGFTREELGEALGREQLVYIGLQHHSLTDKLRMELGRWMGMRGI